MAYTVMSTKVTGYVVLATDWNHIVANFAETAPGKASADGQLWIGTGSNAGEVVAVMDSSNRVKHEYGGMEFDASAITTGGTVVGQSSGVMGIETAMTQGQAEAGSDTQVRGVTAERIKQAIVALGVQTSGIIAFYSGSCPTGWSEYTAARGRYIVGTPSGGTNAGTAGTALTNQENRAVGQHTHTITDPGHTHTEKGHASAGSGDMGVNGAPQNDTSGSSTTGISLANAGTTAGTNAPYIQLTVCQKD